MRRGWQLQSIWPRINGFLIGCSLVAEKPWGPSLEAGVIAAEGQVSHTLLTLASSRLLLSDKCFVPNSKNPASLGPSRGTVVIRHKLTDIVYKNWGTRHVMGRVPLSVCALCSRTFKVVVPAGSRDMSDTKILGGPLHTDVGDT